MQTLSGAGSSCPSASLSLFEVSLLQPPERILPVLHSCHCIAVAVACALPKNPCFWSARLMLLPVAAALILVCLTMLFKAVAPRWAPSGAKPALGARIKPRSAAAAASATEAPAVE